MKFVVVCVVVIASIQLSQGFPFMFPSEQDSVCEKVTETVTCGSDKAIGGTCRSKCLIYEKEANYKSLCGDSDCKCCHIQNSKCVQTFPHLLAFCATGDCPHGIQAIAGLCSKGYMCCKPTRQGGYSNHKDIWMQEGVGGEQGIGSHYHTFDGINFRYSGSCVYILVEGPIVPKEGVQNFKVLVSHVGGNDDDGKMGAIVDEVIVTYGSTQVSSKLNSKDLYEGEMRLLKPLPYSDQYSGMTATLSEEQTELIITIPEVMVIRWNGKGRAIIDLHPSMYGKVRGILGNANGDPRDDLSIEDEEGVTYAMALNKLNRPVNGDELHSHVQQSFIKCK